MQLTPEQKKHKAQEELEWFFWHCDAELGIKSNYHLFIKAIMYSTNESDEYFNEDSIVALLDSRYKGDYWKASARNLQVFRNYKQLSPRSKSILENYYKQKQLPDNMRRELGQLSFLIPMTSGFNNSKLNIADVQQATTSDKSKIIKRLKSQAEALYNKAINEYIKVCEKGEKYV